MNAREKPTYAAIDMPAYVNAREVLLAVRRDSDPEQRVVIAMFENEARWLHAEGRLMCWEPPLPSAVTQEGGEGRG